MKVVNFGLFPALFFGGAAAVAVVAPKHGHNSFHHRDIANRTDESAHWKRVEHARWTFYDVGLGACGKTNVPSDFIVALNSPQFGGGYPGPHCFQTITMKYGGKTAKAQIMDQCPGCPYGGLDLSRGLFDFFASEDLGVIYGSWSFGDSGGDDGDDDPPKPTTTKRHHTTSKEKPTTTEKPEHTTSSKHRSTTSTVPSTTSTSSTPTSTSTSTEPSATSTSTSSDGPANLNKFVLALDTLGGLVVAGSRLD
ncbi:hypothetical protein AGABI1DRAFT_111543 [Agaricus bisporus var. burnettii JB137-S8]|uniref:RlpA-like protein double-psi beta-barrel domain-containing protein n=2 Tax=Agaricus bisporus var. burnettii TaxID=192524 RepID=K5XI58_AGABU|nr:uncharacterized protein AGABI1DRAFT_111543 [Agaricus bisporus var. burnettii JB137-S8]EKM83012.1 hypothetical protein AGABI1DRAFT_111543 [Agaricus bisporus var. burnettii JB137-S8]KAF7777532.1 hypothetical protein Agabi119p4_3604 [Agaricus bisporus var. burnettii]